MKKKIFILMVVLQLGVFLGMVYEKNMIIKNGQEYRFKITYYDPYDFMRGNYLRISLEQTEIDKVVRADDKVREGYFIVEEKNGFARFTSFTDEKPKRENYIKGELYYSYDGKNMIKNPFERYYIEQRLAPEMEKKLKASLDAYLVVKVHRGKYVIESIEI